MKTILNLFICGIVVFFFSCNKKVALESNDNELNNPKVDTSSICTAITFPQPNSEASAIIGLSLQIDKQWRNGQVLRVRFLNGTEFQREQVRVIAPTWSNFGNITFEFIERGESEIRISFNDLGANNSTIGTEAFGVDQEEPTMNLSYNNNTWFLTIRRHILHEFGHALGLIHEHLHPENGIQWDKEHVYADLQNREGWDRDQVDHNLFNMLDRDQTNFSSYDPNSIMHYPIPPEWTLNGFSTPGNSELSEQDRCFIGELYPNTDNTEFQNCGFGERGGQGWYVGDFNGDGKDDIMRYKNSYGGAEVLLSTGSSFRSPVEWSGFGEKGGQGWYVGDFNGDGKDDIMRYKNSYGGAEVLLSTGSSFRSPVEWSGFGEKGGQGWYVGDFNGDGKDDIMRYKNSYGGAEVLLSTGSSFRSPVEWSGFGERGGQGWYVGDFNGDRKDDILRYKNRNGGAEVLLSTGTRFRSPVEWSGFGERGGQGWYVGDFNGNGKADIMRLATSQFGGAQVLISSGSKFRSPATWNNHRIDLDQGKGWYIGDFDGDGHDDILRYLNNYGGAIVYLSGGDCFPIFQ